MTNISYDQNDKKKDTVVSTSAVSQSGHVTDTALVETQNIRPQDRGDTSSTRTLQNVTIDAGINTNTSQNNSKPSNSSVTSGVLQTSNKAPQTEMVSTVSPINRQSYTEAVLGVSQTDVFSQTSVTPPDRNVSLTAAQRTLTVSAVSQTDVNTVSQTKPPVATQEYTANQRPVESSRYNPFDGDVSDDEEAVFPQLANTNSTTTTQTVNVRREMNSGIYVKCYK